MRLRLDIQKFAGGTISLGTSGNFTGQIIWSSTSNGPIENTSTVNATLQIKRTNSSTTTGTFRIASWVVGTEAETNGTWYGSISNNWVTIRTKTTTIQHTSSGVGHCQFNWDIKGPTGTSLANNELSGGKLVDLDTIPRYATCSQSLKSKTETSITMNWSSDSTIDYVWYSKNNGSSWTGIGSANAKSGSYTISGLSANTTYNIKTRVRRKDSQLTTDSSNSQIATYDYPYAEVMPNFNIESPVYITLKNPLNRSCTITMYGVDNSVIYTGSGWTNNVGPFNNLEIVDKLYKSIPNSPSGTYKIKVEQTESGSSSITKTGGTYTAVENLCKPTFTDFDFEDINSTTLALTGNSSYNVNGYSTIKATVSTSNKAVAQRYATMIKYEFDIGTSFTEFNYSDDSSVFGTISNASSGNYIVYAVDSRGYKTAVQKSATQTKDYVPITRSSISATRQNNISETTTLNFTGIYWGDTFGSVSNSITSVSYRYKKTTEDDTHWVNGTTSIVPTTDDNEYSFSGNIVGDITGSGFDAGYSYNIEVTVNDRLSYTIFTTTLGSGSPNMAFVEGGVSFLGKYDESDTTNKVQINGNTNVIGALSINGNEVIDYEVVTSSPKTIKLTNGTTWNGSSLYFENLTSQIGLNDSRLSFTADYNYCFKIGKLFLLHLSLDNSGALSGRINNAIKIPSGVSFGGNITFPVLNGNGNAVGSAFFRTGDNFNIALNLATTVSSGAGLRMIVAVVCN